uniref:uncharacterized protein LOC120333906 n=1 Tax=Styela clava TaxID=7725 RepID=UPI001939D7C8|nr:uncharacterized protein LOC120333906 [Styela clava]
MEKRKSSGRVTRQSKHAKHSDNSDETVDKYAYLKENLDPQPEVYTKMPPQPKKKKSGQLSKEQIKHFFDKGYVLVEDYFDKSLLEGAKEAINELVDLLADILYKAGKITDRHEDKGFADRLTALNKDFPGASVIMHKLGLLPQAFKDIWSNDKLLNAVEQIVGPEIAGHPVWNLRSKTPKTEQATVPWHQDNAYLEPCSLNVMQLTAWIPLIDATKVTGCMEVISKGHRKGVTANHTCCAGETWYVELTEKEIEKTLDVDMKKDVVLCEVPYGGVLFLNNAIPHRSLENYSDKIRWSLDLRWQRPDFSNGFHGLAENILMRTSKDPNFKIDWSKMDKSRESDFSDVPEDSALLKPIITGPWMHRWEITHQNSHTRALVSAGTNWHFHDKKKEKP